MGDFRITTASTGCRGQAAAPVKRMLCRRLRRGNILLLMEINYMSSTLIIVDFENVQNISDLSNFEDVDIKIIVGNNQNKIALETVQLLQKFGSSLDWIQVPGQGKNALDFFVAYFLGKHIQENKYQKYFIISKDTGYDPLIEYLKELSNKIERLINIKQIKGDRESYNEEKDINLILDIIKKMNTKSRPKKRTSLISHLETALKTKKTKEEIIEIVEVLFERQLLTELNGQLKYSGIKNEE